MSTAICNFCMLVVQPFPLLTFDAFEDALADCVPILVHQRWPPSTVESCQIFAPSGEHKKKNTARLFAQTRKTRNKMKEKRPDGPTTVAHASLPWKTRPCSIFHSSQSFCQRSRRAFHGRLPRRLVLDSNEKFRMYEHDIATAHGFSAECRAARDHCDRFPCCGGTHALLLRMPHLAKWLLVSR